MADVLFIHHAQGWGGAPKSLYNLIIDTQSKGISPKVLFLKDSAIRAKFEEAGVPCFVVRGFFFKYFYRSLSHTLPSNYNKKSIVKLLRQLTSWVLCHYIFANRAIREFDVDIIHLNSLILTDWLKACSHKAKVIIHVREPIDDGWLTFIKQFMIGQMSRYADQIIAISHDNAKRLKIPCKTTVIYNHVTKDKFIQHDAGGYNSRMVVYLGGNQAIKGFEIMVEALEFLDHDVHVLFVGGNWDSIPITASVQDRYSNIRFINICEDVIPMIDQATCLVSPFLVPHFSRPIIEAFARKKPVIAFDIEGIREQISDGIDGIVIGNISARDLANAIKFLCENPEKARNMGEAGYMRSWERHSESNIAKYLEIIESMITGD